MLDHMGHKLSCMNVFHNVMYIICHIATFGSIKDPDEVSRLCIGVNMHSSRSYSGADPESGKRGGTFLKNS